MYPPSTGQIKILMEDNILIFIQEENPPKLIEI